MSAEKSCYFCPRFIKGYVCKECTKTSELTPAQQNAAELLEAMKNLLNAKQCPNCRNIGEYAEADKDGDPYPCQCEWCYTVENSIFNRKEQAKQLIAKCEGKEG